MTITVCVCSHSFGGHLEGLQCTDTDINDEPRRYNPYSYHFGDDDEQRYPAWMERNPDTGEVD